MGILTSYLENGTKLKSLKFGGGDKFTSQPFIQTPIPSDTTVVTKPATPLAAYTDNVVSGALISLQRSALDVERLTKYMATPNGVQFALKQNMLSRVAVGTETSGFFNEGIYTPLSTIAQAGVGVLGIHLNKQGLLPTSRKKYGSTVYKLNQSNPNKYAYNRLVSLHFDSITYPSELDVNLYKYKGGPGSLLGIGSTKIKYATDSGGIIPLRVMGSNILNPKTHLVPVKILTTANNAAISNSVISSIRSQGENNLPSIPPSFSNPLDPNKPASTSIRNINSPIKKRLLYLPNLTIYDNIAINERKKLVLSSYYSPINNILLTSGDGREIVDNIIYGNTPGSLYDISPRIAQYIDYSSVNTLYVDKNVSPDSSEKYEVLNQGNSGYLANLNKNVGWSHDARGKLIYNSTTSNGSAHNIGSDFRKVNRKVRGFIDHPDTYDNITKTTNNIITDGDYFDKDNRVIDKIYYTSDKKRTSTKFGAQNDLIEFSISIVNPTNPEKPEKLTFRAYIDTLSDTYSPDWNSQTYMGRGEKFYKYNSFDRKISLGFTVAAEGQGQLISMYSQLNQLVASLAPTYTNQGYMAGNIHKLTIGNYISNQYGIINGLTYEIMEESPWRIDPNYQLPMYIKVTGFQFTPIHDFRPEYFPTTDTTRYVPGGVGLSNKNKSNFFFTKKSDSISQSKAFINTKYTQSRGS